MAAGELKNVFVILKDPMYGSNIGASIRAAKNWGLGGVRVVNPDPGYDRETYILSHGARDLLADMKIFPTLAEAVKDCSFVVGTSRRIGGWRRKHSAPREAASEIVQAARSNRVALLFGREDRGLSNQDILLCHLLLHIPAAAPLPSLNLSQAVLLIGYELLLAAQDEPITEMPLLAPVEQFELLMRRLKDLLVRIDYITSGDPDYRMLPVRNMFHDARLEPAQVRLWLGVVRQINRSLNFREYQPGDDNREGEKDE